jgi:membrane protease YdiL (CAAX protease family)
MKPNAQNAIKIMLLLLSMIILFHVLIITKTIPYTIAWGGRLQTDEQMYMFETTSIFINLFLGFIVLMKGRYINYQIKNKTLDIVLWIFLMLFIINTIGNIFAQSTFEKMFSLLTLLLASLIWVILRRGKLADKHSTATMHSRNKKLK